MSLYPINTVVERSENDVGIYHCTLCAECSKNDNDKNKRN